MTHPEYVEFPNSPFFLSQPYLLAGDQPKAVKTLTQGVRDGLMFQTLLGVTGSGKTYTMANIIARLGRPAIILAPNKTLAAQLYAEMRDFFPNNAVEYFVSYYDYYQPEAYVPTRDLFIDKSSTVNKHVEQMRLSATKSLLERKDTVIVSTVSCIYGIGNPRDYHAMILILRKGDQIIRHKMFEKLVSMQYIRDGVEFTRGTFRVRGEVVDIFPAENADSALRVIFFDNEIESIELFNPLTGQTFQELSRFTIYPNSHYVMPRSTVLQAISSIQDELQERVAYFTQKGYPEKASRLEQRTLFDIEMLQETGFCKGIENYSRHFSKVPSGQPPPTLIDYLPTDTVMFIDESHITIGQLRGMYRGDRSRKNTLVEYGFRLPSSMDNRPLRQEEFEEKMCQCIFVSATPTEYEKAHSNTIVEQLIRPTGLVDPIVEIRKASTQVDDLFNEITNRVSKSERILVTTITKRMAENLTDFLVEHNVRAKYMHSDIDTIERVEILRDLRLGSFDVLIGINLLREGIDIPEVSLVAILDSDKEGFLRSERSLIQTIGRAARNANGYVILYADRITNSIRKAVTETNRRRETQIRFNQENNITPRSINKSVSELIEGVIKPLEYSIPCKVAKEGLLKGKKAKLKRIQKLEKLMVSYSSKLEFEKAAVTRDKINFLKNSLYRIDNTQ